MQCVYKNCGNNSRTSKRAKGLLFHPFPKIRTQKAKYERWMLNCGVDQQELGRTGYVCSLHFQDGSPTNKNPDPIPWDELSLDVALKKKSKKVVIKTIVIDDEVPDKTLNTTASSELILDLDCVEEDLTEEQNEFYKKEEKEYSDVVSKFEQLIKQNTGEYVHRSEGVMAAQYMNFGNPPALASISSGQANGPGGDAFTGAVSNVGATSGLVLQGKPGAANNTYQLVMDPRLGLIVGTMTPTAQQVPPQSTPPSKPATPSPQTRGRRRGRPSNASIAPPPPPTTVPAPVLPSPASSTRPAESTAVGGLAAGTNPPPQQSANQSQSQNAIVDLTTEEGTRSLADSREIAFNKLQGKTFPSLVVVARPHLGQREANLLNDRSVLDTKVKQVLVYTPTKFTEWLIQQGLVRSEQTCAIHPGLKLNLGMYSDVSKFPYSGGYVWISECCPHRFVSVFNGSIFESSIHPPAILLKLIYHWACQTNIQNVVQWVKVDNLYVKGLYTWLRASCTLALHKNLRTMGGPGKKIEVGVISLGTTSQDGSQRQVKVEVLGILEPEAKLVRLRAVEPLADGERNYKRRFTKILEPLRMWVHPESTIATDLTVDKGTLYSMGFVNVEQGSGHGNQQVMEYLRKIVPRMFQNTLSLLSRQIIQQFLDELVWREWYGKTACQAFTNMTIHLAEQTRLSSTETLIQRLNKVAANPFKQHITVGAAPSAPQPPPPPPLAPAKRKRTTQAPSAVIDLEGPTQPTKRVNMQEETGNATGDSMVPLESYYLGELKGDPNNPLAQKVVLNVRCCVCKVPYTNNIQLLDHLLAHAHNISAKAALTQCHYCLANLNTVEELNKHIGEHHPTTTRTHNSKQVHCVICETPFSSVYMLGKHISKTHVPLELPYQCGTCGYRCSSHRDAIDHFYREHDGATTLQCPFCLKSTTVWSSGRIMSTNVTFFLAHLQKHQKKAMAKKCGRCALWFIHKETLKDHQTKAHESQVGKRGVIAKTPPNNFALVPKSKLLATPTTTNNSYTPSTVRPASPDNTQHRLTLVVSPGRTCKECKRDMLNADHYPRKLSCSCCRYVTDCMYSMYLHKTRCNKVVSMRRAMPKLTLPKALHCVCGYSSDDGHQVAKHLANCERKTAYPTAEGAQYVAAHPAHSMLDVLGLVRRNDDKPAQELAKSTQDVVETALEDVYVTEQSGDSNEALALEPKIEITENEVQTGD